jgi:hypothetical protein
MRLPFLAALTSRWPTLLLLLVVAVGGTLYYLSFEGLGVAVALVGAIFLVDHCARADPREVQARLENVAGLPDWRL